MMLKLIIAAFFASTVTLRSTTSSLLKVKDKLTIYGTESNIPLNHIALKPFPFISGVINR